jgi:predicted metal-dependent peptidase
MNYDKDAERAMIRARIHMLRKEPFFGSLALRLALVEATDLQFDTLATDGESLFYSPRWVRANSADVRKSGIGHEVGHCMMQHLARLGERNPEKWNRAGDYVINAMLKDAGFVVGDSWLYDPKYANLTTDAVYRMLPDQPTDYEKARVFDAMLPSGKTMPAAAVAQQWTVAVVQAANTARKTGKLPASIERFVKEMLSSRADWGSLLRRFITERARNSFDWMKPSRKAVAAGVHLPGRYSEQMSTLVVVTDDSGSISNKVLAAFSAETAAAREAATPLQTYVLSCDARINHVAVLEPDDPFVVKNHGGGGTDFRPPFAWLEECGIVPSCLVYLTDLEGRFPKHPPDYPVLWCSINDNVAPWGETIKVEV